MQSPLDRHIIVTQLDYDRLSRLLEQHGGVATALESELDRAVLVPPDVVPGDVVTMDSEVVYEELETGAQRAVRVVYPRDADVARGWISVLAPIGSALLGLRVGQTIRWPLPGGPRSIKVVEIRYQPESVGQDLV